VHLSFLYRIPLLINAFVKGLEFRDSSTLASQSAAIINLAMVCVKTKALQLR